MKAVLEHIERALVAAISAQPPSVPRRARLRTTPLILALTVTAIGGSAVAAVVADGPIDRLLSSGPPELRQSATDRQEARLSVTDAGGLTWQIATYITRSGLLGTTVAPDGLSYPLPPLSGSSGFALALNLARSPIATVTLEVAERHGVRHHIVAGTVDENARRVTLTTDGRGHPATLGTDILRLPVDVPRGVTVPGADQPAAELPGELRLRTFAATLVPQPSPGRRTVSQEMTVTYADGTTASARLPSMCLGSGCEDHALPVAP